MELGDILKTLLENRNITQRKLAADLNIASTTLGNYIRNVRQPDFETLKALAKYFDVSVDYLLDFHNDVAKDYTEEELIRIYRAMTVEQKQIFLEQGKVFLKYK